jgi:hypothetical protein
MRARPAHSISTRLTTKPAWRSTFSQTNPGVHPQFNLQPSDPIFTNTRAILNDPNAIAGNITGTYSGCTTQTTTSPDVYQSQYCNAVSRARAADLQQDADRVGD